MNRQVANFGEDPQGKGKLIGATIHDLARVDGHVLASVGCQQLRQ